MFGEWKKRRELEAKIKVLQNDTIKFQFHEDTDQLERAQNEIHSLQYRLDIIRSDKLTKMARKLGIEIPNKKEWWWNDSYYVGPDPYDISHYLNEAGRTGVAKLIRDDRRANIEWWVKIISPVIPILTGLIGTIGAVLAALIALSK